METGYWSTARSHRVSRRTALRGVTAAGVAAAALPLGIDCGGGGGNNSTATPGAAGSPSSQAAQPIPGGTARQAQPQEIPHFDPHTETYPAGFVVSLIHAGLLRFKQSDQPNELVPEGYLAQTYEQPDSTTFTVKLRPNATFQDLPPVNGRAVTAEDVKFSFERIKTDKPEFQRKTFFAAVSSIDAIDATTVRFKLSAPFAPLTLYMADTWNVIVPKEVVAAKGDLRDSSSAIGAGPYLLSNYQKGVGTKMARNPKFWLGNNKPYINEVQMPLITDSVAALAAFRSKQLDFLRGLPWSEVNGFKNDSSVHLAPYSNVDLQYIRINTHTKPFDDPRVRRAMSMAIDRNVVGNSAFQGNGIPAGVFPAGVTYAVKPDALPNYKTSVSDAKALLSAAGYPNGLDVENLYPSGTGKQQDMAAVVSDQLRQAGINVKNRTLEYGAYLQAALSKDFAINIHWGNRYDEPDGYAIEYLQDGGRNFGFWGSSSLDAMINAQRQELDAKARAQKMADIQTEIANQMYTVGLANWKDYDAWSTKLQNFANSVHWFRPTQQFAEAWFSA